MTRPAELKYTESHEWVRLEGDVATVGITDFAVEQLGDLAFIDLPDGGTAVAKDAPFGEIESTKTASQLFAPLSGEIIEVHTALCEELQTISDSPFEGGWMIKIRLREPDEVGELLSAEEYTGHVKKAEEA